MVAIKFLLPGACSIDRVTRFEREARAVAKIKGDHVAKVLDRRQPGKRRALHRHGVLGR